MFLTFIMWYKLQAFRALTWKTCCVLYHSKTRVSSNYWFFIFKSASDLPTGGAKCYKKWDAGTDMLRSSQFLQLANKMARLLGEEKRIKSNVCVKVWERHVLT